MSNINNNFEYICLNARRDPKGFVEKSEQRYKNIIDTVCNEIVTGEKKIILISGPSASGKTTTGVKICTQLRNMGCNAYPVSLDDFYKEDVSKLVDEEGNADFEGVDALDLELVKECFTKLINDGESDLPTFDFIQKRRFMGVNHLKLEKGDVIVLEGIHALNPAITENLPGDSIYKIYVNVSSRVYDNDKRIVLNKRNIRFLRRLVRDYYYRNSSTENTFTLWKKVLKSEDEFIFPYRDMADAKINSVHIYEPCVLKNIATEMLMQLPEDSEYKEEAQRLIKSLENFPVIENSLIPPDSLVREFVGIEL